MRAGSIARLVFWVAVAVPLLAWTDAHTGRLWLTDGLVSITAVYAIFLLAHLEWMRRHEDQLSPAAIVLFHLNGLWAFGGAYLFINAVDAAAAAPVAAAFAIWNGLLAFTLWERQREHAVHAAALGFTLLMVAMTLKFDGASMIVGWAAEGAVIAALGLRERREWLRTGGLALFTLAIAWLIVLLFTSPPVDMVVLLNRRTACGAFVIALTYWLARAAPRSASLSGERGPRNRSRHRRRHCADPDPRGVDERDPRVLEHAGNHRRLQLPGGRVDALNHLGALCHGTDRRRHPAALRSAPLFCDCRLHRHDREGRCLRISPSSIASTGSSASSAWA